MYYIYTLIFKMMIYVLITRRMLIYHEPSKPWKRKLLATGKKTGYAPQNPSKNVGFGGPMVHYYMGVSKNYGTPKSSILIGFSIINHPFWGIPFFGNTHMYTSLFHPPYNSSSIILLEPCEAPSGALDIRGCYARQQRSFEFTAGSLRYEHEQW